ncbi:hypothetical protein J7L02_01090, partial [Candidatus Woesearchaeota archaeon]|nr:hypothetical protein [Candidatus Woesearchaeota archaeon]
MSNKRFGKGQISMFVILGLVLVIVISVMAYVLSHTISKKPPRTVSSVLGYRYEAFRNFVESCLELELDKELRTIALNGGYLNPEDKGFFTLPEMPTEANAVSFFDKTIPYWFYMDSPNNCQHCSFKTQIPLLEGPNSIEEELETIVAKNIVKCFNNFSQFKEKGVSVTMLGKPSVDVSFTSKAVQAKLDLNLKVVVDKNEATCFGTFSKTLNIPFKSLYRIARELTFREILESRIEDLTFKKLVFYTLGENPDLPPLHNVDLKIYPIPRFWFLQKVKRFIESLMPGFVSAFQVKNSKNYFVSMPNSTLDFGYALASAFDVKQSLQPDEITVLENTNAIFSYLDWPIYLNIKPSYGSLVMSKINPPIIPFLAFLPFPSVVEENFLYDISFPVLVTLKYEAPNVKPFIFRFAWEANIRDNNPLSVFENATVTSAERELNFCDPATFSADVTVTTLDENGNALPGVDIGFECA